MALRLDRVNSSIGKLMCVGVYGEKPWIVYSYLENGNRKLAVVDRLSNIIDFKVIFNNQIGWSAVPKIVWINFHWAAVVYIVQSGINFKWVFCRSLNPEIKEILYYDNFSITYHECSMPRIAFMCANARLYLFEIQLELCVSSEENFLICLYFCLFLSRPRNESGCTEQQKKNIKRTKSKSLLKWRTNTRCDTRTGARSCTL